MKYLGFNTQQFGDLIINTVACQRLKQLEPDCHITLAIAKKYADIAPIFFNNPCIDSFYITSKDDEGFGAKDEAWIACQKFDHVFAPMQRHPNDLWFMERHQSTETLFMHGLPTDDTPQCHLNQWFNTESHPDTIAILPYAGYYNPNNDKRLSEIRATEITRMLIKMGYKVLQLGGKNEPKIEGAYRFETNYVDSVKNMMGCRMLITTDSAMSWIASGYTFPALGLYSNSYYVRNGQNYIGAIQPRQAKALYLDAPNVNEIPIESIKEKLDLMLK